MWLWAWSLAAAVPAQNVWIVDAAMGSGAHVRDIPLVLPMAADGDRILVRPGVYSATNLRARTLTIVGEPGAEVRAGSGEACFAVIDLAAHQAVSIRGFRLRARQTGGDIGIYTRANQGSLHLESLDISGFTYGCALVETSRAVDLVDVSMRGGLPCCSLYGSNVAMTRCTLLAAAGNFDPGCGASDGRLSILDCVFKSGDRPLAESEVALTLHNCSAVIAGNTVIAAGRSSRPASALALSGGSLELDSAASLLAQHSAPAITMQQGARVVSRAVPTLRLAAPGKVALRAAVGSAALTLASTQVTPIDTGVGLLFCDVARSVVLDVARLPDGERAFALPAARGTLGEPLVLQSVVLEASGALRLTPALPITH